MKKADKGGDKEHDTGQKEEKQVNLGNLAFYKQKINAELKKLEAQSSAKDVAGKAIGRYGLFFITTIVIIGVIASIHLEQDKIAAVMGLLGSSLTALISLLASIAGANEKEERPEFTVIRELIEKLDVDHQDPPMTVDVKSDGNVTVRRGDDNINTEQRRKQP
tara:strand:+ start:727 stop:1215 length:489 start_codon:yes stop_codon:yes gene_type:complete